ncbi:MAG: cell envelope biogenesis protein OmpA [Acidobacteria bacterium]|nr:MAG: cell envelope biogenesis protein OmpA [Acidobacteriota bacterium]
MKKLLMLLASIALTASIGAQDLASSPGENSDLPSNPEPGKCYVRCKTPDVYKNEEVTFVVKPGYTTLVLHPAEYETVTEQVLVKEEEIKLVVHPAEWGTEEVTYISKQKGSTLSSTPATFVDDVFSVVIKAESAFWVLGDRMPDCESADPNDCRVWCYKKVPAVYETYPVQKLGVDATTQRTPIKEESSSFTKKVITKKAWTEEVVVPAEYATIKKTVLKKDAWYEEVKVEPVYKTITKEVLEKKGGLTSWKEVDCQLTEYNVLPLNWDLNSAELTLTAKSIIDDFLLPVLTENEGVMVEISSHTDSRNSKAYNQDLSERRARAVVDYLISKGINGSRLVSKGYGESKLINRCADGVPCTEREHLQNRRTEFRIISQ